jgi:processive 1,2-diacylglycerol beta-glucosyltransferase
MRAAEAVEQALLEVAPGATVRNVDVLTLTNAAFRQVYGKAYLDLVNRVPHVLGYFYDLMDQPSRSGKNRSDRLRQAVERLNLRPFIRFLQGEPWDLVINTHFLPAAIISTLRQRGDSDQKHVTVTTDFETHRLWVNQPCDHYYTATEEGAKYLQHWGVPASATTVTGIPVHLAFSKPKDRASLLSKHGLQGDRPIVLQLSGGFGVGPIAKITRGLLEVEQPIELVVIAGKNEEVKTELQALEVPARHRKHVLGFTKEIDELMAVADLVVSKPGGLTTSETLARGAVMAIVNPIPGQETRNSDYLLESGAAIKVNNIGTLPYKIDSLLADQARLAQLKANVARIARPRAAFDVATQSLAMIGASQARR